VLQCVFKRRFDGGAQGKAGRSAGGGAVDPAGEELEVGGDTDWWGRPVSECEREEGELGRAGFVGRKRRWASGEKEREGGELLGWAERRGREV
jgi:hypothetical protein